MSDDATLFPLPDNLHGTITDMPGAEVIGHSRAGRPIHGITLGHGPLQATLIAGSHAEEPAGPALLRTLVHLLANPHHPLHPRIVLPANAADLAGRHILDAYTLHIIPHLNPDGEQQALDSGWLRPTPTPSGYFCENPESFQQFALREQPGDDIEFGWPWSSEELTAPANAHPVPHIPPTTAPLREENAAAAQWLLSKLNNPRDQSRPLVFHASLHGMAYATGAWCLIGRSWTNHRRTTPILPDSPSPSLQLCSPGEVEPDRSRSFRESVASAIFDRGLPLHDMDRGGEKGFHRLGPGFSTAPDVWAMRHHFLGRTPPDPTTAAKFRPSSMDFVRGLALDPLIVVSEVPMFLLYSDQAPTRREHQSIVFDQAGLLALERLDCEPPGESVLDRFRARLNAPDIADTPGRPEWIREFRVAPVPAGMQVGIVGDIVLAGLGCAAAHASN